MSLTSYRAAPPRGKLVTRALPRGGLCSNQAPDWKEPFVIFSSPEIAPLSIGRSCSHERGAGTRPASADRPIAGRDRARHAGAGGRRDAGGNRGGRGPRGAHGDEALARLSALARAVSGRRCHPPAARGP